MFSCLTRVITFKPYYNKVMDEFGTLKYVGNFQWEYHSCPYTNSASLFLSHFLSLCLYHSKGGSGSLGSFDSNGQQELQMAENLIYYSREEGKKRHVTQFEFTHVF